MIISYLLLLTLILTGIKKRSAIPNRDYISIDQTKSIQGIFVLIIIFSHFSSYIDVASTNIFDNIFVKLNNIIGQLMVTMFLFYSGYGIMYKIKTDKEIYLKNFINRRFLPVYIKFFISILLFIILNICLGTIYKYSFYEIMLSFTAWTKIGNSNWFMFATFALYFLVIIAFKFFKFKSFKSNLIVFSFFTIIYILFFSLLIKRGTWWYNTILCFPAGMWFCLYIDNIEAFIFKNYIKTFLFCIIVFCALYLTQDIHTYIYCILSVVFCALIVLVTVKIKIGNKMLSFFGNHIFSIYMLQRLSYILFNKFSDNIYLYFIMTFTFTIIIAVIFDFCFDNASKLLSKTSFKSKIR